MQQVNQIIEKLKSTDSSPKYYRNYPRLFQAYFPNVQEQYVNELCDAGYLYYRSILMVDSLFDDKKISNAPLIFHLQEETIKILTSIYGRDSEFWKFWQLRKNEYYEAVAIEKKLTHENAHRSVYEDLADKKSAFGKIAIDSLFVLYGKKDNELHESLLKSHALFSVGFQLYDDVKDFREDIDRNQFNWAVYTLSQQVNFAEYDVNTLNKYLYIKGVGQELLQKSMTFFDKAIDILKPYNIESEWISTVQDMRTTISLYLDSTEGYLKTIIKKLELKRQINPMKFFDYNISNPTIQKGLDYIKNDFNQNYAELNHVMFLSKQADGFDNTSRIHYSDTFQRAILNDCLMDIAKKQKIDISDYIRREINHYIGRKNEDSVGGWSYFPTVKEIAADTDDLGQIMQLFLKAGYPEFITEHCEMPIQIALNNQYNKNGGIATWLIPNTNRTEIQNKQILFNETKWGTGPDVEVTANFIYALHLYNSEKYSVYIKNAIDYIINNRHNNGYWDSRWYYGSLYGTYVCLRLLKPYQEYSTAKLSTARALVQLRLAQNDDGGYGLYKDQPSDPLSTALAILTLKLFSDKADIGIRKAELFLKNTQQEEGCWEATDFIKPKVNEPYKSRTLTTAYVLQSLCL
jgi:hypothetical protein